MKRLLSLLLVSGAVSVAICQTPQDKTQPPAKTQTPGKTQTPDPDAIYQLGPLSKERMADVKEGKLIKRTWDKSKMYPNTDRDWWIYVPAGYDASKTYPVMVFQDGNNYADPKGQCKVGNVFDNLIAKKEIPALIGVFINPGIPLEDGKRISNEGNNRNKRNGQRSKEYDTLSADYAKFLETEILPDVAKDYNLTKDPNQRAICGISSGGICAFTAAWERPDLFRKVLSHVGSFTNIRGGHVYPALVRKTKRDPKPLRVFLQDGSRDLDNEFGNWPLANQEMAAAFKYAGYDYRFEFGEGGHNLRHGAAIMPESLKWLWREEKKASTDF